MTDILRFATEFTVYDGRQHVLGASMIAAIDDFARRVLRVSSDQVFRIKRAKFTVKTGCDGEILVYLGGALPDAEGAYAATVTGVFGEQPVAAAFSPDSTQPVRRSAPSANRITAIEPTEEFGGSCHIVTSGLESTLRSLVDANKLVQLSGRGLQGHFGDRQPITELVYLEGVELVAAMHELDTDVEISSRGGRVADGRLYTLNSLAFADSRGNARRLRMAFSFETPVSGA